MTEQSTPLPQAQQLPQAYEIPPPPRQGWGVGPMVWLALIAALAWAAYKSDARIGDWLAGKRPTDVGENVLVRVDSNGKVTIVYADKSELPSDGFSLVVVAKEDHTKSPERLGAFLSLIRESDWPVVVFLNATGFDPSGDPIVIRRAADGKELYKAGDYPRVALAVPRRDGGFSVHLADGSLRDVTEKEWVEKYMRLAPAPDPKDLEKMSDSELRRLGYERISIDEAKKRGLVDKDGKPAPARLMIHDLRKDEDKDGKKDKEPKDKDKDGKKDGDKDKDDKKDKEKDGKKDKEPKDGKKDK